MDYTSLLMQILTELRTTNQKLDQLITANNTTNTNLSELIAAERERQTSQPTMPNSPQNDQDYISPYSE